MIIYIIYIFNLFFQEVAPFTPVLLIQYYMHNIVYTNVIS